MNESIWTPHIHPLLADGQFLSEHLLPHLGRHPPAHAYAGTWWGGWTVGYRSPASIDNWLNNDSRNNRSMTEIAKRNHRHHFIIGSLSFPLSFCKATVTVIDRTLHNGILAAYSSFHCVATSLLGTARSPPVVLKVNVANSIFFTICCCSS